VEPEKLKLTLLLPGRLGEDFSYLYNHIVEKVLWVSDERNLEALIRDNEFDVAMEWQYGHQDHTVLDLVKKYKKRAKVILFLNWNGKIPDDFDETGYFAYIDPPSTIEVLREVLERAKESLKGVK